ncbi:MAG TPA: hypothetical protein DCS09_04710 [Porphyromonadaceae bacterium]|nr:hypothetical protein [Porphyromonadaceae bacterium]
MSKMELLVLIGQRKQRYEGEHALEALAVIDEYGDDINPEYMKEQTIQYSSSDEFDALSVIRLSIDEPAVRSQLYPEAKTIPAEVV